jgi:hypothetical protein
VRRVLLSLAFGLAAAGGCSVLLDTNAPQCRSNADCARFGNAVCNPTTKLCAPGPPTINRDAGSTDDTGSTEGGTGACHDPTGCVPCGPTGPTLLDACTNSTCVSFDNQTRLLNLDPDGKLKPLPQ